MVLVALVMAAVAAFALGVFVLAVGLSDETGPRAQRAKGARPPARVSRVVARIAARARVSPARP